MPIINPSSLANLQLWLRADSLNLNDGNAVASWVNEGSIGDTFSQGNASQRPTYKTGISKTDKPGVLFDASSLTKITSGAAASSYNFLHAAQSSTIFLAFKNQHESKAAAGLIFDNANQSNAVAGAWVVVGTDNLLYYNIPNGAEAGLYRSAASSTITLSNGDDLIISIRYEHGSSGDDLTYRINRTVDNTNDSTNSASSANASGAMNLGSRTTTNTLHWNGYLYEIIFYSTNLTDAQIVGVEDYLYNKYFYNQLGVVKNTFVPDNPRFRFNG